jgi:hypothetical protein
VLGAVSALFWWGDRELFPAPRVSTSVS